MLLRHWRYLILSVVALLPTTSLRAEDPGTPKLQDFRKESLRYPGQIEAEHLVPFVDDAYIRDRLTQMIRMINVDAKGLVPDATSLRPHRSLSFHIVVRFDVPEDPTMFGEFTLPPTGKSVRARGYSGSSVEFVRPYEDAVTAAITNIAEISDLRPEVDPSRADLLIHINLAERQQSSVGFGFEKMKPYPERMLGQSATPLLPEIGEPPASLEQVTYALPWTYVRLFYTVQGSPKGMKRSIEGGEIWMQYPVRTFWQETLAQTLFQDMSIATLMGLGSTRTDIVGKFRTPHKTKLPAIWESIRSQRQPWTGSRPNESLLSATMGLLQEYEPWGAPAGGYPDRTRATECATTPHSQTIGWRLVRALVLATGGLRANALLVDPAGDYTSEFERDKDRLLSELSLVDYQRAFDRSVDDQLSLAVLRVWRGPGGTVPTTATTLDSIVKNELSAIRRILLASAQSNVDDCGLGQAFVYLKWPKPANNREQ
jgi:hypothetical protein